MRKDGLPFGFLFQIDILFLSVRMLFQSCQLGFFSPLIGQGLIGGDVFVAVSIDF